MPAIILRKLIKRTEFDKFDLAAAACIWLLKEPKTLMIELSTYTRQFRGEL